MARQPGNDFDADVVPLRGPTATTASFADRLHGRRADLPGALSRLVAVIEDDPELLVGGTITSLAERAGVAASTVTRLSRALGYPSVARMRMAVAREVEDLHADEGWSGGVGAAFAPDDSPAQLLAKLTLSHLSMIRSTAAGLDVDVLQSLAERIAAADRVEIYAIGGSANAARMFAGRAFRIGLQVRVWDEVHDGLVSASFLGSDSVAVAVSTSGRTPEVAQMIREARRAGAFTVAMVAQPGSPVATASDVTVTTMPAGHPEHGDLTSRYGQGFALDLLFLLLTRLDATAASERFTTSRRTVQRHRRDWDGSHPEDTTP